MNQDQLSLKRKYRTSVFKSSELAKILGNRTAILRAVEQGTFMQLNGGYYSTPDLDPFHAMAIVAAKYYPIAVISGISSAVIQGISDERPEAITIDVPRDKSIRNALFKVRRRPQSKIAGLESYSLHGVVLRIYNLERTLCDLYKYEDEGVFFKALKLYVKTKKPNTVKINRYDKLLKTKVLSCLKQELADG